MAFSLDASADGAARLTAGLAFASCAVGCASSGAAATLVLALAAGGCSREALTSHPSRALAQWASLRERRANYSRPVSANTSRMMRTIPPTPIPTYGR